MSDSSVDEQSIPADDRLKVQLLLVELLLHITVTTILGALLWSQLPHSQVMGFIGTQVGISILRLVIHFLFKPGNNIDIGRIVGSLLHGIVWGIAVIVLFRMQQEYAQASYLASIAVLSVTIASFIGAVLRPWPLLAFVIPAMGMPLVWSFLQVDIIRIATLAVTLLIAIVLAIIAHNQNQTLSRIRSVTRQNTTLLSKLASARDNALQTQKQAESANENLKLEISERERAEEKIRSSERELSGILEDLQDTYFRVNQSGIIERITASVLYLTGYKDEELLGKPWAKLFSDTSAIGDFSHELDRSLGHLLNHEICLRHRDDSQVWASVNAHYYYENDKIIGFEGTARDITEKRRAEEIIFSQKERLRVTLESIDDGVLTTDTSGLVEYMNPKAEEMTGWDTASAIENPLAVVMNLRNEDDDSLVEIPVADWVDQAETVELSDTVLLVQKDGNKVASIELTGSPIRDSIGAIIGSVLVFRDVTKLRSLTKQLAYQATHDSLTELPNRIEFEKRAQQLLQSSQTAGKQNAICYADLDQFKVVNDACGHHAGDKLLQQVTRIMQDQLRDSDMLARLGGDEFGVLLPGCPLHKAEEIAEKLRLAVEEYRFVWEGDTYRIGLSIGLVPITRETPDLTELLKFADSACYVAKDRGRNCVHVFRPDDSEVAEHRDKMQWMKRIQQALEEDLFELHFQKIAHTEPQTTSTGLHGEILIRMRETDDADQTRLISPTAFIPSAERYHLMPQVDRWVVKNALRMIVENKQPGIDLRLCTINLSGQSMGDHDMLDFIMQEIKASHVPASTLCFEITESAVISNLDFAREFINKLNELGCSFALDDFGSGLSSFDYLKNLPVDYVKLDGSLIKDVASSKVSQAMVHAINYVSHVMGMKSIAEYVENEEILEQLRRIDIDYVQGYAIAKPVKFDSVQLPKLL